MIQKQLFCTAEIYLIILLYQHLFEMGSVYSFVLIFCFKISCGLVGVAITNGETMLKKIWRQTVVYISGMRF
jgi:hypothetical protein